MACVSAPKISSIPVCCVQCLITIHGSLATIFGAEGENQHYETMRQGIRLRS